MEKGLKLPRRVKGVHWPDQSPPCPGISANACTHRGTSYGVGGRGGPGLFSCLQGGQVQEAGLGGELGNLELLSDSPFCSRTRTGHDCSLRLWSLDNKTCVQEITAHRKKHEEAIHAVACHPSKALIASAGADALAKVFV